MSLAPKQYLQVEHRDKILYNECIYLRVYDAGNNADFADKVGTEYTLEEINQMAAQKGGTPDQGGKFY